MGYEIFENGKWGFVISRFYIGKERGRGSEKFCDFVEYIQGF